MHSEAPRSAEARQPMSRGGLDEPEQGRVGPATESPTRSMRPRVRRASTVRRFRASRSHRSNQPARAERTPVMATTVGEAQLTRVGPERPRPTGLAILARAPATTSLDSIGPVHPIWQFRMSAWAGIRHQRWHAVSGCRQPRRRRACLRCSGVLRSGPSGGHVCRPSLTIPHPSGGRRLTAPRARSKARFHWPLTPLTAQGPDNGPTHLRRAHGGSPSLSCPCSLCRPVRRPGRCAARSCVRKFRKA